MQAQQSAISLDKLQAVVDSFYHCNGITPPILKIKDTPKIDAEANALESNTISITTGFISSVAKGDLTTVDFLSAVAHESGHIKDKLLIKTEAFLIMATFFAARYAISKSLEDKTISRRQIIKRLALTAGGIGSAALAVPFIKRQQEVSADNYAAVMVGPDTYTNALEKISRLEKSGHGNDGIFSFHPAIEKRVENVTKVPSEERPCIIAQENEYLVHKETARRQFQGRPISQAPER